MTYCLALKLRDGLVFASDSRTTAGVDYISTYRKMHVFQPSAERLIVILTSGNLATTQAVIDNLRRDLGGLQGGAAAGSGVSSPPVAPARNLASVSYLFEAARYVGTVLNAVVEQYASAFHGSLADARATLIVGGQIAGAPPELYLVYPEGNYIAATEETPFLQLGEFKYGKPILSRIAVAGLSLDDAARLALISFDAAMKSNLSVGPPVELAIYPRDRLGFSHQLSLEADSELLRDVGRVWNEKMLSAFRDLPRFDWELPASQGA
jgi:putative proteasome-type protease